VVIVKEDEKLEVGQLKAAAEHDAKRLAEHLTQDPE
jgi:hypothetical protein